MLTVHLYIKMEIHVYFSLSLIPARTDDRVFGVFAIAKDITDKKKSEKKLAESELKFSSIVEEALIGVYIVQVDGKIIYGNKKFYEMLRNRERQNRSQFSRLCSSRGRVLFEIHWSITC